jgi:RNA polymerase sigma-70 factor (ECF subfamily)
MTERALSESRLDEAELVESARRKDRAAVRSIIKQHNRRLYRLARSIVRDDSEAEDVLQEAYLRAFASLDSFRGEAQFGTWIGRIVINEALGSRRRKRSTIDVDLHQQTVRPDAEIIPFPAANPELDPEKTMAQREIRMLLEGAIDRLPETFRQVLVARLIEGMSVQETADLFAIPPQTVKTRLHRARGLLKREMEKHIGPVIGGAFPFAGRRCDRLTENVLARLDLA